MKNSDRSKSNNALLRERDGGGDGGGGGDRGTGSRASMRDPTGTTMMWRRFVVLKRGKPCDIQTKKFKIQDFNPPV